MKVSLLLVNIFFLSGAAVVQSDCQSESAVIALKVIVQNTNYIQAFTNECEKEGSIVCPTTGEQIFDYSIFSTNSAHATYENACNDNGGKFVKSDVTVECEIEDTPLVKMNQFPTCIAKSCDDEAQGVYLSGLAVSASDGLCKIYEPEETPSDISDGFDNTTEESKIMGVAAEDTSSSQTKISRKSIFIAATGVVSVLSMLQ
uniref:Uncharacterized protein n=1 Tax=Corethron hystrix TaxID=216773 RepID=A0A7S1G0X0_9STRA|mmetsp:Transcript_6886/g.14854  ORF Transcript_6886/g.14854 Transcript_6886/m.14854 type:complete len:202 (+) Transcript_6886:189-794(+)